MGREQIGKIIKSDGTEYPVYLLKVYDLVGVDFGSKDFHLILASKSLGIKHDDFLEWDYVDGIKVITMVMNGFNVLSK